MHMHINDSPLNECGCMLHLNTWGHIGVYMIKLLLAVLSKF